MQKRENPYTPGAGRKPRTLAGRDDDLEQFHEIVQRLGAGSYERSLIYTGLRGVGKTVLLIEFDALASDAGWVTTDVQEVGSQPDFRRTFARMAVRLLTSMSKQNRAKEAIERALSVVKSFSVHVPGGAGLSIDLAAASGSADSGDPESDLVALISEIGDAAAANQVGALFLIDEMQNLDASSLAAICMAFQVVSRKNLPVALVGAGLPDLKVRLLSAKPYADRLFTYRELGHLEDPAAHSALVGPASLLGVDFERDVARDIVLEAAGYPYFIQEFGQELWNYAERSPVTHADLEAVRPIVHDSLDRSFFGTRLATATDTEQRLLFAMAALGDSPYRIGDVVASFGAQSQQAISVYRAALIDKGLIWGPKRGVIDFTVPMFADYLRRSAGE